MSVFLEAKPKISRMCNNGNHKTCMNSRGTCTCDCGHDSKRKATSQHIDDTKIGLTRKIPPARKCAECTVNLSGSSWRNEKIIYKFEDGYLCVRCMIEPSQFFKVPPVTVETLEKVSVNNILKESS